VPSPSNVTRHVHIHLHAAKLTNANDSLIKRGEWSFYEFQWIPCPYHLNRVSPHGDCSLLADESNSWASGLAADAIMPSFQGVPDKKKVVEFC
jgi:hypothetical protein